MILLVFIVRNDFRRIEALLLENWRLCWTHLFFKLLFLQDSHQELQIYWKDSVIVIWRSVRSFWRKGVIIWCYLSSIEAMICTVKLSNYSIGWLKNQNLRWQILTLVKGLTRKWSLSISGYCFFLLYYSILSYNRYCSSHFHVYILKTIKTNQLLICCWLNGVLFV